MAQRCMSAHRLVQRRVHPFFSIPTRTQKNARQKFISDFLPKFASYKLSKAWPRLAISKYLYVGFKIRVCRPVHDHKSHPFILYYGRDAGRASPCRCWNSSHFRLRWRLHVSIKNPEISSKNYTEL